MIIFGGCNDQRWSEHILVLDLKEMEWLKSNVKGPFAENSSTPELYCSVIMTNRADENVLIFGYNYYQIEYVHLLKLDGNTAHYRICVDDILKSMVSFES